MSKRRFPAHEEGSIESLTPEERRAQRRRERVKRKAQATSGRSPLWRRVAIVGGAAAAIGIAVVLLLSAPLPTPCINFQPVPNTSGVPDFPNHNLTDFTSTWCPSASQVYGTAPYLKILIEGTQVSLPNSIGRNTSYPNGYECDLPVKTEPPAPPSYPDGSILITSSWNYRYNLSTFFDVWGESYKNVFIDSSHPSQPIVYQTTDLLGYSANATERISLFVDGQPSSSGPLLDLTGLDYQAPTIPSCLGKLYGTGHTIVLSYTKITSAGLGQGWIPDGHATAPSDPQAPLRLFYGPLPHVGFLTPYEQTLSKEQHASLAWLALRPTSA